MLIDAYRDKKLIKRIPVHLQCTRTVVVKEEFSSSVFFLLTNDEECFLVSTLLQGPFTVCM